MSFAEQYGPWALVAGASDGVGAAMAFEAARRGLNVVLLARRQTVLDQVATSIRAATEVQTRTVAVDLASPGAAAEVITATADLEIGFLVYCAGADPTVEHFLAQPISAAESMVQRNCMVPLQLAHHYAGPMVERGRGGIVIFGSGAGFAGGPNMVAYGASKAFDMVFAEVPLSVRDTQVWHYRAGRHDGDMWWRHGGCSARLTHVTRSNRASHAVRPNQLNERGQQ